MPEWGLCSSGKLASFSLSVRSMIPILRAAHVVRGAMKPYTSAVIWPNNVTRRVQRVPLPFALLNSGERTFSDVRSINLDHNEEHSEESTRPEHAVISTFDLFSIGGTSCDSSSQFTYFLTWTSKWVLQVHIPLDQCAPAAFSCSTCRN